MQLFFQIVQNFLQVYSLIVFGYIFASWIPTLRSTPIIQILSNLVEPYFALFRKFPFARLGHFSLAPMYALLFLNLIKLMVNRLQAGGNVNLGYMSSILLAGIWGIVSFLLWFFCILALIRLFFALFFPFSAIIFTQILDMLLSFAVSFITTLFFSGRNAGYKLILVIIILLNFIFLFFGAPVINQLSLLLQNLKI